LFANLDNKQQKKIGNESNNIKSNLTCSIMNLDNLDNQDDIFGYPILQYKKSIKNIIELYPIPELVSYKGFISQNENFQNKLTDYYDNISNNNDVFYYWMPIYIDEEHFEENKNTKLNTFSLKKSGIPNNNEYKFESQTFLKYL
jgi:hypothetical protein